MQAFYFFNSFKQRLCIFSQKLSNENKQRLYKIQKRPTSLFYHVLLIKQNECNHVSLFTFMFSCITSVSEARPINKRYHSYPYVIRLIISERPRGHQLS